MRNSENQNKAATTVWQEKVRIPVFRQILKILLFYFINLEGGHRGIDSREEVQTLGETENVPCYIFSELERMSLKMY